MKQPCFHQKIIGDVLSLYRNFKETFFNNNRNILTLNVNNTTSQKSQLSYWKTYEYFRRTESLWLSRNFQLFSSFRNFQAIFGPSNTYFTEKSLGAPDICFLKSKNEFKSLGIYIGQKQDYYMQTACTLAFIAMKPSVKRCFTEEGVLSSSRKPITD